MTADMAGLLTDRLAYSNFGRVVLQTASTPLNILFAGERVRPAYGASKAGVTAVVRLIASKWGRDGIRCNAVSPGPVLKESAVADLSDDERQESIRRLRSHRMGKPSDVGSMAAYLLSDDGEWINGQVYSVNGGIVLR